MKNPGSVPTCTILSIVLQQNVGLVKLFCQMSLHFLLLLLLLLCQYLRCANTASHWNEWGGCFFAVVLLSDWTWLKGHKSARIVVGCILWEDYPDVAWGLNVNAQENTVSASWIINLCYSWYMKITWVLYGAVPRGPRLVIPLLYTFTLYFTREREILISVGGCLESRF